MRLLRLLRNRRRITYSLLATLTIIGSVALPALAPFLTNTAYAAGEPTRAEMMWGGMIEKSSGIDTSWRNPDRPQWRTTTCQAAITRMPLTDDLIFQATRIQDFNSLKNRDDSEAAAKLFKNWSTPSGEVWHDDNRDHLRLEYYRYIKKNYGQQVQVVSFYQAQSNSGTSAECGGEDALSGRFILIPVRSRGGGTNPDAADRWVACQSWTTDQAHKSDSMSAGCSVMMYTAVAPAPGNPSNTTGRIEYYKTRIEGKDAFHTPVTNNNFIISGLSKPGNPVIGGNVSTGAFVDASRIEITSTMNGSEVKETFVDPAWDGRKIYFLESTTNASRQERTYSRVGGTQTDDPLANPGASRKVPFITYQGQAPNISFNSRRTAADFQKAIDAIATGTLQYYNYGSDGSIICEGSCPGNGLPSPVDITSKINRNNARIWFYASSDGKDAASVFSAGDGNERNYAGTYIMNDEMKELVHAGPGCAQLGSLKIGPPSVNSVRYGDWTLRPLNTNCNMTTGFGTVRVLVSYDPEGYKRVNTLPSNATLPSSNRVGKLVCDVAILNPLTWLMCPIATAATSGADQLDSAINNMLEVNSSKYFGNNEDGNNMYKVWKNTRIIALAIIVIAGLLMVLAQASGWEVVSALTFKRAVPRFMGAIILLVLWWPIGIAIMQAGDVATFGIRQLLYAPFSEGGSVHLQEGLSNVMTLIGTGAILALGIFGVLTFAVTAFLAILVGYGILLIRLLIIVGLHVTSAFFIPFYAFPNTQKVWSFFWGGFTKAVAIGPVLAGAIALARIMSWIIYRANPNDLGFQIMAIVCYFGIYFLLAEIVTAVGGFAAMLAGRFNDRSRGAFDSLKNMRRQQVGSRWDRAKKGEFFQSTWLTNSRRRGPLGAIGRFGDNLGKRAQLGARNNFGFGQLGKQAMAFNQVSELDEVLRKNPALRALGMNDDSANAVLANSGGTVRGARDAFQDLNRGRYNAAKRAGKSDAEARAEMWDEAEQRRIMKAITPFLGSQQFAAAAQVNMMQNKARGVAVGDWESLDAGANRLAGGNSYLSQFYKSNMAYLGRSAGRVDLGGEWNSVEGRTQELLGLMNVGDTEEERKRATNDARSYATMLDGMGRTNIGAVLGAHPSTLKQASNVIEMILNSPSASFELKKEAAIRALELQKGVSNGMISGDAQKVVNDLVTRRLGINLSGLGTGSVADQIALKVTSNTNALSGQQIWAEARAYDNDMPANLRGSAPSGSTLPENK